MAWQTVAEAAATLDAILILRGLVPRNTEQPTDADCWLLNAALHLEGRVPSTRISDQPFDIPGGPDDVAPLWFYRWIDGASLRLGAIVRDGKTFYGPVKVAVVLAVLLASPAAAADRVALGALVTASVADAVTTELALRQAHTRELNPALAGRTAQRLVTKAATTGVLAWGLARAHRTHPRLVTILTWTAAGSLTALAAHNAQIGGR